MQLKLLWFFPLLIGTIQAGILLGNDGILHKAAKTIGIDNLVNIGADARVNVLGNQVGIDGAVGIGGKGIGAHASADADVLGQKAKVHADILDGHKIDQHNHEVFRDSQNRQYVLQRQYIGSKSVQVRKYLDNGNIYVDGANEDNVLQHKQVDDFPNQYNIRQGRIYDVNGGWWDLTTRRYYNRLGQWISSKIWDPRILMHATNADKTRIYDNDGGWWDLTTRRYYNNLGQWISSRVWDPSILFRNSQSDVTKIYDQEGGWWDLSTKRYYNRLGKWISTRAWNPSISLNTRPSAVTKIYDRDGGWWDLSTKRYFNRLGQWISTRIWDPNMLNQYKLADKTRFYDNDGGWWDLTTRRYYNNLGQWISGRVWDPTILIRNQSGVTKIYDEEGGWWDLSTKRYYNRLGKWISTRAWNPNILLSHRPSDVTKIYDQDGGWWDLSTKRYYNRLGQWVSSRTWDPNMLIQYKHSDQTKFYDNNGGWWDLTAKRYYNRDGQWIKDRTWNEKIWNLAQQQQQNWQKWKQQKQLENEDQQQSKEERDQESQQQKSKWEWEQQQQQQQNEQLNWKWDQKQQHKQSKEVQQQQDTDWNQQQEEQYKYHKDEQQDQQMKHQQWKQQQQQWNQQQVLSGHQPANKMLNHDTVNSAVISQIEEYKNAPLQAMSRDRDATVRIPIEQLGERIIDAPSNLLSGNSYNIDATLNIKPQENNKLDTMQIINKNAKIENEGIRNLEIVNLPSQLHRAPSKDSHASEEISVEKLDDIPRNVVSNSRIVEPSSVPLVATSRDTDATDRIPQEDAISDSFEVGKVLATSNDRDATANIPLKSHLMDDIHRNVVSKENVINLSSVPFVATSRDRDATVRIPLEKQPLLEDEISRDDVVKLPSVPVVATSRDRNALVNSPHLPQVNLNKIQSNEDINDMSSRLPLGTSYNRDTTVIFRPQGENKSDIDNVEEVVATSRDRDSTIKIPLEQQPVDNISRKINSNEEVVSFVPNVPTSTNRDAIVRIPLGEQRLLKDVISRERVANLPSSDINDLVNIPHLSQVDSSSVMSSKEVNNMSSKLSENASNDKDTSVIHRSKEDNGSDSNKVEEVVATSRDRDATVIIPIEQRLLDDIPTNVVSNEEVIELFSKPLVATARDRDATASISLQQQLLDDIPKKVLSNKEIISSVPLVASSRDRDATIRILLGEQRLLKDVILRERVANHPFVSTVTTSRDKISYFPVDDSSNVQSNDMSYRQAVATSYDRDATVILRPQEHNESDRNKVVEADNDDKSDTTSVSRDIDSSIHVITKPNDNISKKTFVRIISGQPQLSTSTAQKVVRTQNNRVIEVEDPGFSEDDVHFNSVNNVVNHRFSEDDSSNSLNLRHHVHLKNKISEEPVNEYWEINETHDPGFNQQRQLQQLHTVSHNVISRHFLVPHQRKHTVKTVIYQPGGKSVYESQTYRLIKNAQQQKHLEGQEQKQEEQKPEEQKQEDQQLNWKQHQQ